MIESAGMSSTDSMSLASSSWSVGLTGAKVTPQLPTTTEVTPCQHDELQGASQATWASRWLWMSTKPGVTMRPDASMVRVAGPESSPTSVTRSPTMPTSARRAGAPVPSMTVPPVIAMS